MIRKMVHRMLVFMSRRMISCDEASYLVSYRSENRLGIKMWWQLNMHLLTCHLCRKYAHQIAQLNSVVDQYRESCSHETCEHHLPEETSKKMQQVISKELSVK